jgi:hypothetical protein
MSANPANPSERWKQSTEKRTLPFDFTDKLRDTDTVYSVNSITSDAGISVSGYLITGNEVTVQVSGGTAYSRAGKVITAAEVAAAPQYWISCNVNTMLGDILELDCLIRIDDHAN